MGPDRSVVARRAVATMVLSLATLLAPSIAVAHGPPVSGWSSRAVQRAKANTLPTTVLICWP